MLGIKLIWLVIHPNYKIIAFVMTEHIIILIQVVGIKIIVIMIIGYILVVYKDYLIENLV